MKSTRHLTAVLAVTALLGLSGCGGSSDKSSAGPPATKTSTSTPSTAPSSGKSPGTPTTSAPAAAQITISNFDFGSPISVSPGATVKVTNSDAETHTVTADSGNAFDVNVTAGGSATFTAPTKPGSYPFHCNFHSEMHGTLTVK